MRFEEYEIISITREISDVFFLRLKPKKNKHGVKFLPGQFFHIKNTTYLNPNETRPFSAATTPKTTGYIEFCIKTYGTWTKSLLEKKKGESVWLFGPMGTFTIPREATDAVFFAGGVGIAPILSMLQSLHEGANTVQVTLIYANATPFSIIKHDIIKKMFIERPNWTLKTIVSRVIEKGDWNGFSGHITDDFFKKEIKYSKSSTFFICGSGRFIKNMIELLRLNAIEVSHIRQEVFSAAK